MDSSTPPPPPPPPPTSYYSWILLFSLYLLLLKKYAFAHAMHGFHHCRSTSRQPIRPVPTSRSSRELESWLLFIQCKRCSCGAGKHCSCGAGKYCSCGGGNLEALQLWCWEAVRAGKHCSCGGGNLEALQLWCWEAVQPTAYTKFKIYILCLCKNKATGAAVSVFSRPIILFWPEILALATYYYASIICQGLLTICYVLLLPAKKMNHSNTSLII